MNTFHIKIFKYVKYNVFKCLRGFTEPSPLNLLFINKKYLMMGMLFEVGWQLFHSVYQTIVLYICIDNYKSLTAQTGKGKVYKI